MSPKLKLLDYSNIVINLIVVLTTQSLLVLCFEDCSCAQKSCDNGDRTTSNFSAFQTFLNRNNQNLRISDKTTKTTLYFGYITHMTYPQVLGAVPLAVENINMSL
jgi:hypothetical protein